MASYRKILTVASVGMAIGLSACSGGYDGEIGRFPPPMYTPQPPPPPPPPVVGCPPPANPWDYGC